MRDSIDELAELFKRFPGIGERQARRFVYYLIERNDDFRRTLAERITALAKQVTQCRECFRFFQTDGNELCDICASGLRDNSIVMIVEKDADIIAVERSGWNGKYFVFGGLIPIADEKVLARTRINELENYLNKKKGMLKELVLGFPMNPSGDFTDQYVRKLLEDKVLPNRKEDDIFTVASLGRGLSTGTELEYSDPETIKNALANRS
ncbi:MAG: recombination protein RecR [Candidatus Pacebacteria bacterium]|mgnify:CR=1|jgi:recombination protein RecR|nr:recombination protein RecR [Candidatus Paceibacterota bacterium]